MVGIEPVHFTPKCKTLTTRLATHLIDLLIAKKGKTCVCGCFITLLSKELQGLNNS